MPSRLKTAPNLFVAAFQVYPIGIPVLYAVILWTNRELLNPSIVRCKPDSDSADESTTDSTAVLYTTSKGQIKKGVSPEELQELEERVQARKGHPELVPSMFLWKDFGECCEGIVFSSDGWDVVVYATFCPPYTRLACLCRRISAFHSFSFGLPPVVNYLSCQNDTCYKKISLRFPGHKKSSGTVVLKLVQNTPFLE